MIRPRVLVAGVLLAGAWTAGAGVPAGAATRGTPCSTAVPIQITHLAFKPPAVFPGQSSTAHVAARNCSDQAHQTSLTWLARFMRGTVSIPAGCPAIDPIAQPATFAPHGTFTSHLTYLVPAGCTATSLVVTVRFAEGATVLAQQSASLVITRPPAG